MKAIKVTLFTSLFSLLWMSCVKAEYLFTMPRSLRGGSQGSYCFTLRNLEHENRAGYICEVTLQFLTSEGNIIREHTNAFNSSESDWSQCANFDAPIKGDRYTASVAAHIDGKKLFIHEEKVDVWTAKNITLIQTDKPLYKPGQTVKFRILRMDYRFLPLTDLLELITIDNPGGVRVMQWKNVDASKGLVSLEMKLSDDPVLGTWNIKAHGADETVQSFTVEEYVLPKFEVKITPPTYLLPTSPTISGKVCADYTYGQPVKGSLTMKVCFGPEHYPLFYLERPCVDIIETNFDGCHSFSVPSSQLKLGVQGYPTWGSLKISATVRETATGIELNGTSAGPELTNDPMKVEISDDSDGYFKPGFPYNGKVTVRFPDGNPVPNEVIRIKAEKYDLNYYWSKEFTTDTSGIINFSLSNLGRDVHSLSLMATAVKYEKKGETGYGPFFRHISTPNGYKTITQWFSPSLSYIYIPTIKDNVPCDSTADLDVIYSTDGSSTNVFNFVVKAGADVFHTARREVTFDRVDTNIDVLQFNPAAELEYHEKEETRALRSPRPRVVSKRSPGPKDPEPNLVPFVEEEIVPEVFSSLGGGGDQGAVVQEEPVVPEVFSPLRVDKTTDGGNILKRRSSDEPGMSNRIGHFKMPIPIKTSGSEVTVLVYYIRQDKEVVAASLKIPVESCFKNKVKMEFVSAKVRPGEETTFRLHASPNSLCSVGMVDKSVNLMGGEHQLTPKRLFVHCTLNMFDPTSPTLMKVAMWIHLDESNSAMQKLGGAVLMDVIHSRMTKVDMVFAVCAKNEMLPFAAVLHKVKLRQPGVLKFCSVSGQTRSGTLLKTDGHTKEEVLDEVKKVQGGGHYYNGEFDDRKYCEKKNKKETVSEGHYYHYSYGRPQTKDSIEAFRWLLETTKSYKESSNMLVVTDAVLETRPCSEPSPYYPIAYGRSFGRMNSMPDLAKPRTPLSLLRQDVVEEESYEETQVQTVVRSYFPETWLWDLHTIGDNGVVLVTTEVPHTITEWVGNTLCSNSKDGVGVSPMTGITVFQPFFLSFTLPYSAIRGENLPVLVTVFNYMTNCLIMEVRMKETKDFQIQSVSGAIQKMCVCGGDSESAKFHIVPLKVGEIDLEATAVSIEDDNTCVNQMISYEGIGVQDGVRRKLLVEPEGIPQEYTKSFYLCPEGRLLSQVIDLPVASDDKLVPDSQRAKVNVIGDIMGPTLSNLKDLLKMPYGCGEQNMASWSPNIYVLQYLTNTNQLTDAIQDEAKGYMRVGYQRQLKYRHHDGSYSAWGEYQYQNSTGSTWLTAFVVKSMAQSRTFIDIDSKDLIFSMQWLLNHQNGDGCIQSVGQVFSNYLKGGLADGENAGGLTAFALIALLEAGIDKNDPAVVNGYTCLDKQQTDVDTYTLAVMAYAYTLYDVNSPKREQIMAELEARTRVPNPGQKHWTREKEEKKENDESYFYLRAPSAEVEMTAYVLMAYIAGGQEDAVSQAQPIVQWLTKQRNAQGGFSSTQDTVVALQALSMYATLIYQGGLDISVRVDTPSKSYQTGINDSNSLVLTTWDLSPQTTQLNVQVQGKGCTMVQANMKYNIYENKKNETGQASFHVRVNVYRSETDIDNCKRRTLRICARYALPNFSNMAIVEVKMITGWIPVKSTVKELLAAMQIQKYEINPDNVDFYFDQFDSRERCFAFEVEQSDIVVSDPKPALIKVYDYYEIKDSVMILYDIKTTCGTKEELPFPKPGEPYNPFFDDFEQRRVPMGIFEEPGLAEGPIMTCPICTQVIDVNSKDFKKMVCQAEAVYKALVGRSGKYSIKIHSNLRNKGKKAVNLFVNSVMNTNCPCSLLGNRDQKAFILTFVSLLDTEAKELTLDARSTLIPWSSSMEKSILKVTKQPSLCEKLLS